MSSVSFGTCTVWSSALWLKLQSPQLMWLFYLSFGYVNFGEVVFHSRWTVNASMCGVVCHIRTCTLGGLECLMSHVMSRLLVICTSYSLTRGPLPSLTAVWCFAANTHLDDILLLRKSMEPFSLCGDRWRVYQWPTWLLFLFALSSNSAAKDEVCRNLQHCSQCPHLCVHMRLSHKVTVIMGPHVWGWQMFSTVLEQLAKLSYPHQMSCCPYISSVLVCLLFQRGKAVLQETLCD